METKFLEKITEWYQNNEKKLKEYREQGLDFNIFKILASSSTIRETSHSKLLASLFDYKVGNSYPLLGKFIELLDNDNDKPKIGYQDTDIWEISTEVHTWAGNVDIILKRETPEKAVVIIENKVNNAKDQANQLYRYWKEIISNGKYENARIMYLPKDDYQACGHTLEKGEDYEEDLPLKLPIEIDNWSFNEKNNQPSIYQWLENCKKHFSDESHRVRQFIEQYQEFFNPKIAEMTQEAMKLFENENIENWNAFAALANQKEEIKKQWWSKLFEEIYSKTIEYNDKKWEVYHWTGDEKIIWRLNNAPQERKSTSIYINERYIAVRFYSGIDSDKAQELIKASEFQCVKEGFDKPEANERDKNYFCWEYHSFKINNEEITDSDKLAWYAGNQTELFAGQIFEKIKKLLQKDHLFQRINEECKNS